MARSRKVERKIDVVTRPAYGRVDRTPPAGGQYPVMQVFLNAKMAWQHNGLIQVMQEHGIEPGEIEEGQFVVFLNGNRDKGKIFTAHQVIGYIRAPEGEVITLELLAKIPKAFGAKGTIGLSEPMRVAIETGLEMQPGGGRRITTPTPSGRDQVIVRRRPEVTR